MTASKTEEDRRTVFLEVPVDGRGQPVLTQAMEETFVHVLRDRADVGDARLHVLRAMRAARRWTLAEILARFATT